MKNRIHRLIIILTAAMMIFACGIFVNAGTNGITQSQAVAWARNQVGSTYERNYGYQCVDLIRAYYDYLGQEMPTGNANEYLNNTKGHCPSGWTIHFGSSGIQPGDVMVYTGGSYGHVGIVIENRTTCCYIMNQNGDGNGDKKTAGSKGSYQEWSWNKVSGYIHPDFPSPVCDHSFGSWKVTKKASFSSDGERLRTCTKCGIEETEKINKIMTPSLSKTTYTYDGKVHVPSINAIKDSAGNVLGSSNYSITKSNSKSKNTGSYSISIKLKGNSYSGSYKLTYSIKPQKVSIKSVVAKDNNVYVKWNKLSSAQQKQVSGFQVMYATKEDFSDGNKKSINKKSAISISFSANSGTKYYLKLRTKKDGVYSAWSSVKSVTVSKAFSTKDGYVYNCIKNGNYVYCGAGDIIVKVNIKTGKKQTLHRKHDWYGWMVLFIKNNYLYFSEAGPYYSIYRVSINGGKVQELLALDDSYGGVKIKNNKIYYYKRWGSPGYWLYDCRYVDLDGSNVEYTTVSDYGKNPVYKECNVKGYSVVTSAKHKSRDDDFYKLLYYLKKPNGKKIKLFETGYWYG